MCIWLSWVLWTCNLVFQDARCLCNKWDFLSFDGVKWEEVYFWMCDGLSWKLKLCEHDRFIDMYFVHFFYVSFVDLVGVILFYFDFHRRDCHWEWFTDYSFPHRHYSSIFVSGLRSMHQYRQWWWHLWGKIVANE